MKKYYPYEDFENNGNIFRLLALSWKIRIIIMLLWVLARRTKYDFPPLMHRASFVILNVPWWIRMSITVYKVEYTTRWEIHDRKRRGRRAFIFVFAMNLNHSRTDAFCFFFFKKKKRHVVTANIFKWISNENALKCLYAALIASRIIATSRSTRIL